MRVSTSLTWSKQTIDLRPSHRINIVQSLSELQTRPQDLKLTQPRPALCRNEHVARRLPDPALSTAVEQDLRNFGQERDMGDAEDARRWFTGRGEEDGGFGEWEVDGCEVDLGSVEVTWCRQTI